MLVASSLSNPSCHILSYLFIRVESFVFNICTIPIRVATFMKCLLSKVSPKIYFKSTLVCKASIKTIHSTSIYLCLLTSAATINHNTHSRISMTFYQSSFIIPRISLYVSYAHFSLITPTLTPNENLRKVTLEPIQYPSGQCVSLLIR